MAAEAMTLLDLRTTCCAGRPCGRLGAILKLPEEAPETAVFRPGEDRLFHEVSGEGVVALHGVDFGGEHPRAPVFVQRRIGHEDCVLIQRLGAVLTGVEGDGVSEAYVMVVRIEAEAEFEHAESGFDHPISGEVEGGPLGIGSAAFAIAVLAGGVLVEKESEFLKKGFQRHSPEVFLEEDLATDRKRELRRREIGSRLGWEFNKDEVTHGAAHAKVIPSSGLGALIWTV